LAGSITMALADPVDWVVTFCCGRGLEVAGGRALAAQALDGIGTSFCWPIIASPTFWVQSRLVFIIARVCGKATSDFTLTSQLLSLTAATAASPLRLGFGLRPARRLDHFQGISRRHQGLRQQGIGIERHRRQELVELLG